jgi:hypothetical protein
MLGQCALTEGFDDATCASDSLNVPQHTWWLAYANARECISGQRVPTHSTTYTSKHAYYYPMQNVTWCVCSRITQSLPCGCGPMWGPGPIWVRARALRCLAANLTQNVSYEYYIIIILICANTCITNTKQSNIENCQNRDMDTLHACPRASWFIQH